MDVSQAEFDIYSRREFLSLSNIISIIICHGGIWDGRQNRFFISRIHFWLIVFLFLAR